jgi:hypothetical protein
VFAGAPGLSMHACPDYAVTMLMPSHHHRRVYGILGVEVDSSKEYTHDPIVSIEAWTLPPSSYVPLTLDLHVI